MAKYSAILAVGFSKLPNKIALLGERERQTERVRARGREGGREGRREGGREGEGT